MSSYHDHVEALLDSRMQRAARWATALCDKHGLPHVHVCFLDRHCREFGAPRRITLLWGRHSAWLDFFEGAHRWTPVTAGRYSRPREDLRLTPVEHGPDA